jgi:nickel-dependent lactate racemase
MNTTLHYGSRGRITIDVPEGRIIATCGVPAAGPLADVAQATAEALRAPLDYPPLSQMVVPGDKVCLVLDDEVPQASTVVQAIVDGLLAAGIESHDITLLRAGATAPNGAADRPEEGDGAATFGKLPSEVQVVIHDPTDRKRLAYLAASAEGKPVYLDRALADADLVIPIGCLRLDSALGYFGINSTVFPAFSDEQTLLRYRAPLVAHSPVQLRLRREETDQVGWLLGIHFIVEVLPAGDDGVLAVLAGRVGEVERVGRDRCLNAWNSTVPHRAALVLAAVSGPPKEQTWLNVARALAAALRLVEEGGTVAVCTDLKEAVGPAMRYLAVTESPETALREIVRERPTDALAASQLIEAVSSGRIYLLSGLTPAAVEDLGLTPIDGPEQLTRLVEQHPNCVLLANAQYSIATIEGAESPVSPPSPVRQRSKRK